MILRRLDEADATECARLHAQAFRPPWSEEDFRDQAGRPDRLLHGLSSRARALSGAAVSRFVGDEADLLTIVVDRSARGSGHGERLLAYHLRALSEAGVKAVFLEVAADNRAARALYASRFKPVGTRPGYYGRSDTTADALVLRCDLP